jgi:hypothetical protein
MLTPWDIDNEGFLPPVRNRKRSKDNKAKRITSTSSKSENEKIATFSELLNAHIQEAMLNFDRRTMTMQGLMNQYDKVLRCKEQLCKADWEKDEERLTLRESMLDSWETKLTQRVKDLEELERRAIIDITQCEQDLVMLTRRTKDIFVEHKRTIDAATFQSELAHRSWHEVEMAKFKEQLTEHQMVYKARTEDFCEEQLQHLESNLDSSAEYAHGIQEKLLVCLRKDIQQTYTLVTREEEESKHMNPVHVDDAQTPPPVQHTAHMPTEVTETDEMEPPPPTKDRRWTQVDYSEIMQPPTGKTPQQDIRSMTHDGMNPTQHSDAGRKDHLAMTMHQRILNPLLGDHHTPRQSGRTQIFRSHNCEKHRHQHICGAENVSRSLPFTTHLWTTTKSSESLLRH